MLGYSHGSQKAWHGTRAFTGVLPFRGHQFGHGPGEILLDDLECTGNEDSILECNHEDFGIHRGIIDIPYPDYLDHREGYHNWAGVICKE